ncbi:hypothetical protein TWF718_010947 [Orbilia javanica]|uniref:Uncharacterized protein n=1 Tax=Orbilia javanica TaxID=47235 RepID=A0AAN8MGL1_9PEZI
MIRLLEATVFSYALWFVGIHVASAAVVPERKLEQRESDSFDRGEPIFNGGPWLNPTCRLGLWTSDNKLWQGFPFGKDPPKRPDWIDGEYVQKIFKEQNREIAWKAPEHDWAYSKESKPCWNIADGKHPSFREKGADVYFVSGYCYCHFFEQENCQGLVWLDGPPGADPKSTGYVGLPGSQGFGEFGHGNFKSYTCFEIAPHFESSCKVTISNGGDEFPTVNSEDGLIRTVTIEKRFPIPFMLFNETIIDELEEASKDTDAAIEMFTDIRTTPVFKQRWDLDEKMGN